MDVCTAFQLRTIGVIFFFSSRRRHTRWPRDWSSDVCSSDLVAARDGVLNGCHDHVADACVAATRATENTDARNFFRARVVSDLKSRLLLDHAYFSCRRAGSRLASLAERIGISWRLKLGVLGP